jgi:hypothetical protein
MFQIQLFLAATGLAAAVLGIALFALLRLDRAADQTDRPS